MLKAPGEDSVGWVPCLQGSIDLRECWNRTAAAVPMLAESVVVRIMDVPGFDKQMNRMPGPQVAAEALVVKG